MVERRQVRLQGLAQEHRIRGSDGRSGRLPSGETAPRLTRITRLRLNRKLDMARYTGPKSKISRRFGVALFGPSKALERKNYPPGMHGPKGSRRKRSDYSAALAEKQKLRFQYGLMERQFRRYFESA